ncbi:serine hydrolase [Bifidobacterium vansinderenii]|uniref:Beta-lactamase n=1 Tax=Bifidobacterium vansinderenii TaxID=1984871 RepID=A0A229VY83_9BIFI|nr:serine hydrolase [Bifidobacterium vansinderenii]OXN00588.1 beta-lactamase [Bifidobacterium vansinderenii]
MGKHIRTLPTKHRTARIVIAALVTILVVAGLVWAASTRLIVGGTTPDTSASASSETEKQQPTGSASATATPSENPTDAAKQAKQTQLDTLKGTLEQQLGGYSGTWSLYVEDMTTGASISINDHRQPSASVIKLYVMLAVYDQIAQGKLTETADIDTLLTQMITVSSNQATNTLVTTLGGDDAQAGFTIVNDTAKANGFTETAMNDLLYDSGTHDSSLKQTSVNDAGAFMAKVYRGQLVSADVSAKMLDLLLGQTRRTKIPAGVPDGTKVANKTGEIPGTENDAAIVYGTKGDYVITVMSEDVDNSTAQANIRAISGTVWDAMNQ